MDKKTEWVSAIKARDGKCMHCGRIEDLHAHHIKPKADYPELVFDLDNGMTLCYRCHKREHERMRGLRIRSIRPQRGTLQKRIAELEARVALLDGRNQELLNLIKNVADIASAPVVVPDPKAHRREYMREFMRAKRAKQ